jgi:inosine-uridine nucleoside N-ribohydrolase
MSTSISSTRLSIVAGCCLLLGLPTSPTAQAQVVPLLFDTDMGNDVDDALALGVIHALADRGECELLAVTLTKDNPLCAPFVDLVNTFFGRGEVPIGIVRNGMTPDDSRFLQLAEVKDDGQLRYPHDLRAGDEAMEATTLLRRTLAAQSDGSVVIVQVGFSTNLAALLDTPPDEHSALDGRRLVAAKVKLVSAMAGAFPPDGRQPAPEYNVRIDPTAARKLCSEWPTPIVFSGYEIGDAIRYPAVSIENDFGYAQHHPLQEAYQRYKSTPHERPCWDLTSVLYAVRPNRGYFDLSRPGHVVVDDESRTIFTTAGDGRHRYLRVDASQTVRVKEALVQLASQPPQRGR